MGTYGKSLIFFTCVLHLVKISLLEICILFHQYSSVFRYCTASFKKLYPYVICKKSFPFLITDFVNIFICWNVIFVI